MTEEKSGKDKEVDELFRMMMARAKHAGLEYKPDGDISTTEGKLRVIEDLKLYVGD